MTSAALQMSPCFSDYAEAWILLDGKPFRLDDWPMHRAFYDGRFPRTLFKTSRQVAKSTTLANFSIIECALIPYFSTMFVSPSKEQTTRFSTTRVGKVMRYSPIVNKRFLHPDLSDRVFHKQFTNGSEMLFTYGCDAIEGPDRLRGPSTDRNMYDEVQDILYDPVIIVGNETLAESDYHYETYAGTPKSMENTIQYLWDISTQTEWVMKCDACNTYQYIDSERSLGLDGPICVKCGAYLDPFTGQWIDMCPPDPEKGETAALKLKGFHISQLMMPKNVPLSMGRHRSVEAEEKARARWGRILTKHREAPTALFKNEVLGVSDAIGTRMISLDQLKSLCTGPAMSEIPTRATFYGMSTIVAGVDWSGGGSKGLSRTVLWIWGYRQSDMKLVCLFYKVYPGTNPTHIVEEIGKICKAFRVSMVVGDAGEGALANDTLRRALGEKCVTQVQYGSQAKALTFNNVDRYTGDRTTLIDNYIMMLIKKEVEFGPVEQMMPAIDDILNVYEEVTLSGKKVWRHSPQKPDDCLHAGLFGWIAHKLINNDLRFYQQ